MATYRKIKSAGHEGDVTIFLKKRFLFFFWRYEMSPFVKSPMVFNHEYHADAYISGVIEYREMNLVMDKTVVPYSKFEQLKRLNKFTGHSVRVCEEIYDRAGGNIRGEKYYHLMRELALEYVSDEVEPMDFICDYLNNNDYVKSFRK